MLTADQIYKALDEIMPPSLSCDGDNDGFQLRPSDSGERSIGRILISLDPTEAAINAAIEGGYGLLLTHHPVIYRPVKSLRSAKLIAAAENRLALMSFHTRLDSVRGGVNDVLGALLGINDLEPLLCDENVSGRIGRFDADMTVADFAAHVVSSLHGAGVGGEICVDYPASLAETRLCGNKIALLGGSGRDGIVPAAMAGAALYLTGECGYNYILDAAEDGLCVMTAGHYATEMPVCYALAEMVKGVCGDDVTVDIFDKTPLGAPKA